MVFGTFGLLLTYFPDFQKTLLLTNFHLFMALRLLGGLPPHTCLAPSPDHFSDFPCFDRSPRQAASQSLPCSSMHAAPRTTLQMGVRLHLGLSPQGLAKEAGRVVVVSLINL